MRRCPVMPRYRTTAIKATTTTATPTYTKIDSRWKTGAGAGAAIVWLVGAGDGVVATASSPLLPSFPTTDTERRAKTASKRNAKKPNFIERQVYPGSLMINV